MSRLRTKLADKRAVSTQDRSVSKALDGLHPRFQNQRVHKERLASAREVVRGSEVVHRYSKSRTVR